MSEADMKFDATKAAKAKTDAPKRSRASAKEVTQSRRRRRGYMSGISRGPLAIDTSQLDPDYQYRWVEDRPGQIQQMYLNDYDVIENAQGGSDDTHDSVSEGSDIQRPSGATRMVLMRKPREYYEQDRKEHHDRQRETLKQLEKEAGAASKELDPSLGAYVPDGGNKITS